MQVDELHCCAMSRLHCPLGLAVLAAVLGGAGCGSCFRSATTDGAPTTDAAPIGDSGSDATTDAVTSASSDAGDAGSGCIPDPVPVEVCDGRDNDCDGTIDLVGCAPGLEAWYRFEETSGTAFDSSGNGWHGSAIGSLDRAIPGPVGFALGCTGMVGDYIDVGAGPVFDASGGWTVEAWIGYVGFPAGNRVFAKASGLNPTFTDVQLVADGAPLSLATINWSACDDLQCGEALMSQQLIPITSFGHVALSYDGAFFHEYFNGLEADSLLDTSFAFGMWSEPLTICEWIADGGQTWEGVVDELKFWSVARTEAEVCADAAGVYSSGPPATCALP